MPIRMVEDPNDQQDNTGSDSGGGGGRPGGGGLLQLLPMVIGLLIKKPILLLVVLAAGAIFYFKGGCSSGLSNQISQLATGGVLDPKEFGKANIYEGLDPAKTNLPEAVSLLKFAPPRLNQGEQGSCVAWSSAYGARTILQVVSTGIAPDQAAFSPSFLYNQIRLEDCQGSYIIRAMENMTQVGAVPFNEFPYDDRDCSRQPGNALKQDAQQYRMLGFTRLTQGDNVNNLDLYAIKEHLSKDVPVVIGMMVGGSFMQDMMGQEVWHPTNEDLNMMGFGGHALCVIGYDDRKEGGAFQIMNSWGPEWGQNGIGWVRYNDFKRFVREAYGINPMPKTGSAAATDLECNIGLVDSKTKQYIPLQLKSGNTFNTPTTISKGTLFKMEVKNNAACYVYILGMETDGSSYILFPYPDKNDPAKTKFSPYCGITGYRLFPRGMNMQADEIGNKDFMAVVVSKDSMNVFQLNNAVNSNRSAGFPLAINSALSRQNINGVSFRSANDGTMYFKTSAGDKVAVACIVEIDKN